ncbi:MAG: dinitrogenase iron-molybdenum cofactor biosynthesis protein [Zetaproteobacteria bacterium]|nr:MAG: dinitrogenase iron-molybdenum cofactor biosynthesis protein [Zetaproteobacteria bacterium]
MKIAAITDDGKTISQHFGRARYYLVCTVEDGRITGQELRDKAGHHSFAPQAGNEHHASGPHGFDSASRSRHAQMLSTIADCQAVLSGGMGLGMQRNLEEVGIRPLLTDVEDIQEAVRAFAEGRLSVRPELAH